jgi:hypothetical protein
LVAQVASSFSFTDSYNRDDARHFRREWLAMVDCYSEATRENGQLELALGATEAEAIAARAQLVELDAMVAGRISDTLVASMPLLLPIF